jgi:hypothetical protein
LSWLFPSLGLAVLLLGLAGCTPYGPATIQTGAKAAAIRTQQQIADDLINTSDELEAVLRGVKDAATAKAAVPKATELTDRTRTLANEGILMERNSTREQNQQFQIQNKKRLLESQRSLTEARENVKKIPGLSKELIEAVLDGTQNVQQAAAKNQPAPSPSDDLPSAPPDTSGWAVWLLCLIVLGACVGFLFRDGLWSNAICLVNVILAGLLAMNFYEPLATWLTNYSADLHSYVVFFDFLSMWTCFMHRCRFQSPPSVLEGRRSVGRRSVLAVHRLGHDGVHADFVARRTAGAISLSRIVPAAEQHVHRHARPGPRVAGLHQIPVVGGLLPVGRPGL